MESPERLDQKVLDLCNQGDYSSALPLAERSLAIREKTLGSQHFNTAASRNNLATIYLNLGEYQKAEFYLKPIPNILEKSNLPKDIKYSHLSRTYTNLGSVYFKLGNFKLAQLFFSKALNKVEEVANPNYLEIVTINNNLANLYIREGKYGLGEEVLLKYLPRLEKKLGTKHPSVISIYTNLSEIYSKLGKYEKAEVYAQRGLNIKKDIHPLSNPLNSNYNNNFKTISYDLSDSDIYLKLATIASDKGDYIEAKTYLEQALNIAKDKLPHNHPDIGIIYNQLGIYLYL